MRNVSRSRLRLSESIRFSETFAFGPMQIYLHYNTAELCNNLICIFGRIFDYYFHIPTAVYESNESCADAHAKNQKQNLILSPEASLQQEQQIDVACTLCLCTPSPLRDTKIQPPSSRGHGAACCCRS